MRKAIVVPTALALLAISAVPAGSTESVSVRDNRFSPSTVSISRGETVKWVWRGRSRHNVVGRGLNSGLKGSGTYSRRISSSRSYRCTIHPGMTGRIRVR
jgi:plastocyanin